MEVLSAYVRTNSPRKEGEAFVLLKRYPPLGADIQAILTVLGRREDKYDKGCLDLQVTHLCGANLDWANLAGTNLNAANLGYAHLHGTNLSGAYLSGVYFGEAFLDGANLNGANLLWANLADALLDGADLSAASGLTQKEIDSAFGDEKTILPTGLKRPERWSH
jgi:hypothetical protein